MLLPPAVTVYAVLALATRAESRSSAFGAAFGAPKLVGSCNFTHFWFPSAVMQLGAEANNCSSTIVQRMSQRGDGKRCPPTDHPNWPCSAVRMSMDCGSSWQVAPARWPGPLLPQTPLNSKRAADPKKFSSMYALTCVNASCTGKLALWSAAPSAAGIPTLRLQKYLPLTVQGVPADLQLGQNILPVMLRGGSILLAMYVSNSPAASDACSPRAFLRSA